jgi:hypothetical protein
MTAAEQLGISLSKERERERKEKNKVRFITNVALKVFLAAKNYHLDFYLGYKQTKRAELYNS